MWVLVWLGVTWAVHVRVIVYWVEMVVVVGSVGGADRARTRSGEGVGGRRSDADQGESLSGGDTRLGSQRDERRSHGYFVDSEMEVDRNVVLAHVALVLGVEEGDGGAKFVVLVDLV